MLVKLYGSVILVRLLQLQNAQLSILFTLFGIVILAKFVQSPNAPHSIEITLFGIVTLTRFSQPLNAYSPILVTVYPSISDGIVNSVAVPLYFSITAVSLSSKSHTKSPLVQYTPTLSLLVSAALATVSIADKETPISIIDNNIAINFLIFFFISVSPLNYFFSQRILKLQLTI